MLSKKEIPFHFSFLKGFLFCFCSFSIHQMFSSQSVSVLVVYCQYICVYLGFLQWLRRKERKVNKRTQVKQKWTTSEKHHSISLSQIPISPHAKDSQYPKKFHSVRCITQYLTRQTQGKTNQKLKKFNGILIGI